MTQWIIFDLQLQTLMTGHTIIRRLYVCLSILAEYEYVRHLGSGEETVLVMDGPGLFNMAGMARMRQRGSATLA